MLSFSVKELDAWVIFVPELRWLIKLSNEGNLNLVRLEEFLSLEHLSELLIYNYSF